jgi:hypothetical protein
MSIQPDREFDITFSAQAISYDPGSSHVSFAPSPAATFV